MLTVFDVLFPPQEGYTGIVHFAVLTKDKKLKSLGSSDFKHLTEKIKSIKIHKSLDYYLTANTTMQFTRRNADNLFSLNNIVIDFDIHSAISDNERSELLEEFIFRVKRDLLNIQPPFRIPKPNVIHYTGRGVQMWWHIDTASSKLLFLYHRAIEYLIMIFKEFLSDYPNLEKYIDIDTVSSKNAVGLFRMFKTYNTHTNRKTTFKRLHDKSIDLNTLVDELSKIDFIQEHLERQKAKKQKKQELNNDFKIEKRSGGYTALHQKRLMMIKELATERAENIGERDIMLFLAFNSARQIMPLDRAKELCHELNQSFSEPLKNIDYIFKNEKIYKIKNETFFKWLNADESLNKKAVPNITRDIQRQQNKEEREIKKARAEKLLKEGQTIKVVAEKTGLSVATVNRISAAISKNKSKKKKWEELGVSKATYYRHKNKG